MNPYGLAVSLAFLSTTLSPVDAPNTQLAARTFAATVIPVCKDSIETVR